MPRYDYRCEACTASFEARHGFHDPAPACPDCGAASVHREITSVPHQLKGMATDAGRGGTATKAQLQAKWAEETPKLREKLADKLGEETVRRYAPSLGGND